MRRPGHGAGHFYVGGLLHHPRAPHVDNFRRGGAVTAPGGVVGRLQRDGADDVVEVEERRRG